MVRFHGYGQTSEVLVLLFIPTGRLLTALHSSQLLAFLIS